MTTKDKEIEQLEEELIQSKFAKVEVRQFEHIYLMKTLVPSLELLARHQTGNLNFTRENPETYPLAFNEGIKNLLEEINRSKKENVDLLQEKTQWKKEAQKWKTEKETMKSREDYLLQEINSLREAVNERKSNLMSKINVYEQEYTEIKKKFAVNEFKNWKHHIIRLLNFYVIEMIDDAQNNEVRNLHAIFLKDNLFILDADTTIEKFECVLTPEEIRHDLERENLELVEDKLADCWRTIKEFSVLVAQVEINYQDVLCKLLFLYVHLMSSKTVKEVNISNISSEQRGALKTLNRDTKMLKREIKKFKGNVKDDAFWHLTNKILCHNRVVNYFHKNIKGVISNDETCMLDLYKKCFA